MRSTFAILAGSLISLSIGIPINDGAVDGDDDFTNGEIYNGNTATPHSWPWMAHIAHNGNFWCGATLVRKRWVLTAAHCVGDLPRTYTVTLGDHNRKSYDGMEQIFNVTKILVHPSYDSALIQYDVALMKLDRPAIIDKSTVDKLSRFADADLEAEVTNNDESECYITGWGYEIGNDGNWRLAPRLQELQTNIVNASYCTDRMLGFNDPYTNLCYEAPLGASCNGDSGSPIVCQAGDRSQWYLFAVHSFKINLDGCRGGVKAGTKLSVVSSWIESATS